MKQVCPRCGTTIEEFRRTMLLGCPECYNVFREEVLRTVRLTQGKTRHEGKSPASSGEKHALVLEQELLKKGIERALKEGRYADAEEMNARLKEYSRMLDRVEGKR